MHWLRPRHPEHEAGEGSRQADRDLLAEGRARGIPCCRSRRSGSRASGSSIPRRPRCGRSPGRQRRRRGCVPRRSKPWRRSGARWADCESKSWPGRVRPGASGSWRSPPWSGWMCDSAAARAAELIPQAAAERVDLKPLMAAFLNRQGAGAVLAAAIERQHIPADAAKLALRAVYSLGLTDPALVDVTGPRRGHHDGGQAARPRRSSAPWSPRSPPRAIRRGARSVFRRNDLNCMTCHSVSKAGGEVGPDLSSIGQSSPPDYIINSILIPDQSIKEQYHTLVVLTTDGQVYQGIVTDKDNQRIVLKEATGRPAGRSRRRDRGSEDGRLPDAQGAGQPDDPMPSSSTSSGSSPSWDGPVLMRSGRHRRSSDGACSSKSPPHWPGMSRTPDVLRDRVLAAPPDRWTTAYAKVAGELPLDEVSAINHSKVLFLQGELNVSAEGTVRIRLQSPAGMRFWVDDIPAPAGTREFITDVTPGRHTVTLRVDVRRASRIRSGSRLTRPTIPRRSSPSSGGNRGKSLGKSEFFFTRDQQITRMQRLDTKRIRKTME